MVLNGALRESPRNMIQGWYKILKNIQTKQAGNIRSHESHESREVQRQVQRLEEEWEAQASSAEDAGPHKT